ncbi:hypothetical protein JG687_00016445 [Phytophthora cactorum]|uniref:Uncharacterized protein n=2 Tax=Phytophthora cactorum TaxID=29920 RepID=A0A8T1TS70_9STRA|nr:hypothetical protein JG687_00016445 [Phytophthora cactorum]
MEFGRSRLTTEDQNVALASRCTRRSLVRGAIQDGATICGSYGALLVAMTTPLYKLPAWLHAFCYPLDRHRTQLHKCRGYCEYAKCQGESQSDSARQCSRSAGHEGKCEKGEHTCGQECVLARASNCDNTCSKVAEHPGDHRCSVQVHICGSTCSAETCNAACVLDIQRDHCVHKCVEVQCLRQCFMRGCKDTCGEKDHFHGQLTESRAFAEENGVPFVPDLSEDSVDDVAVTHMCLGSHACPEMCRVDGICEQKVHLKKSARTYAGARGSFEYIYQEMNGCKKQCTRVLPSCMQCHEGVIHSCIASTEQTANTSLLSSDTQSSDSSSDATASWRRDEEQQ